jgi:hypothetical protein
MHICNRCQARHKVVAPSCSVCGFRKLTEWKAAASREGVVAISAPTSPKDIARLKIGWKNTVKSISNDEGKPRPGRWIAFYIPTSYMPLEKDINANGFRVTLTIKLLTNGTLRYHGITHGSEEFTEVKDNTIRLSKLKHGWHYAQVTGSGTEANHTISLELEERAYARCEDSPESKPLIPWTFWYFPHSTKNLPVAFLNSVQQEELTGIALKRVKDRYTEKIEALKKKRIEDEESAESKLNRTLDERLQKALEEAEIPTDEYYDSRAQTAKDDKKAELRQKFNAEKGKTEDLEALKLEISQAFETFCNRVDVKLAKFKEVAAAQRKDIRDKIIRADTEELLRIRSRLDRELNDRIRELELQQENALRIEKEKLLSGDLIAPLVTFAKHFSAENDLKDAGKAVAWESNPENGHYGDREGWTGHCDAAGFASALFVEPVDKGIWKGEELKFIATEYFMSHVLTSSNAYTTWQLGETDNRNDPSHLNYIGHFRGNLNAPGEHAKRRANEQKVAAGKNGASLLDKLQGALSNGMPTVMDIRVNADFSEDTLVLNAKAVWNHCVFCYKVRYRESADATGTAEERARDLVAHITIYANEDHSPPTTTKSATIDATEPPDITVIPGNCIIRHCAVRLQYAPNGKINLDSEKADWLGCHAKRRQTEELDFEYGSSRLPPRYLTITVSKKPTRRPMANPHITPAHIEALIEGGYLKWSRKL